LLRQKIEKHSSANTNDETLFMDLGDVVVVQCWGCTNCV
jgi:hypothetical protein